MGGSGAAVVDFADGSAHGEPQGSSIVKYRNGHGAANAQICSRLVARVVRLYLVGWRHYEKQRLWRDARMVGRMQDCVYCDYGRCSVLFVGSRYVVIVNVAIRCNEGLSGEC